MFKIRFLIYCLVGLKTTLLSYYLYADTFNVKEIYVHAQEDFLSDDLDYVTSQEIEERQARDARSMLQYHPATNIRQEGGKTSLSLRSHPARATTVIQDGITLNDPSLNHEADLSNIDPLDYKEVEIITGPHALFYDNGAYGGVLNLRSIVPKEKESLSIFTEGGSYRSAMGRISGAHSVGESSASLILGKKTSGQRRIANHRTGFSSSDHNESSNAKISLSHAFNTQPNVILRHQVQERRTSLSEFVTPDVYRTSDHRRHSTVHASSMTTHIDTQNQKLSHLLTVSQLSLKTQFFLNDKYNVIGNRKDCVYTGIYHHSDSTTSTFITQYQNDSRQSTDRAKISNNQFIVKYRLEQFFNLKTYGYRLSGIFQKDQLMPSHNPTYQGGIFYKFNRYFRLFSDYGIGYHSPSLCDISGTPFSPPNTKLRPEKSILSEVGLESLTLYNKIKMKIVLFNNKIKNALSYDPVTFQTQNLAQRKITGLEVSTAIILSTCCQLTLNLSKNDAKDQGGPSKKTLLTPKYRSHLALTFYNQKDIDAFIALDRQSSVVGIQRSSGTVHDLNCGLRYHTEKLPTVNLRFENILNNKREISLGYGRRGLAVFLGLSWTPN